MAMGAKKHLKGALVDKYAEIALFDAAENQRVIMNSQRELAEKKAAMKKALDAQLQYQQEVALREREEDREWVRREQERIKVWNAEEEKKIYETKSKNDAIKKQREQQLRELDALRARERQEQDEYDANMLRDIKREIQVERAKEHIKRKSDEENLRKVAEQNVLNMEQAKKDKDGEIMNVRRLEAEWAEVLNKQERARDRLLKATYSRQAKQGAAADTMQEKNRKMADEDERRAARHVKEIEEAAVKREHDQKAERARLQRECLEVLAIQVREKSSRVHLDRTRDQMVLAREQQDLSAAEKADSQRRGEKLKRNYAYKAELMEQMRVAEERKTLEPYLMSKAERQMNAELLKKLDSTM